MTGINPGKSHGQGPWLSHEMHRLDDSSLANRKARSCSILLMGEMRLQWRPRLERSRLGLQVILDCLWRWWVVERFASPPLRVAVCRVEFLRRGPSPFFWVVDSFGAGAALGRYRSIGPGAAVARVVLMGWRRYPP